MLRVGETRRQWMCLAAVYGAVALFFAFSARMELRRYPVEALPAAAIYGCLLLLFALFLAPGFAVSRNWLAARFHGPAGAAIAAAVFLLPYLLYAAGTGDFRWPAFAKLLIFAAAPFLLFTVLPVRVPQRLNWQDLIVLAWLALPVFTGATRGIWNVPLNLDFMARVFLVAVGAWSFLVWRGVAGAGYEFTFSGATLRDSLTNLAAYTAIGLPLGLALRFIAWNPHWRGFWAFLFDFVTIFVFIAIAEELYFRGLLQNLLEGTLHSRYVAQAIASTLFGLSHIRHAPFPNWRYVILATVAGWFYGSAYRRRGSLMASAMTHALVDTIWRTWLTFPRV